MAKQRFVTDAGVREAYDSVDTVTVDDDGGVSFEWSEMPVVEIDSPPHEAAFDTDQFYKIEDVTVGRPIKQLYVEDGEVRQLKKPAAELESGGWSFDNVPHTCGHPDTGMVKDVRDVTGFWRHPNYDWEEDRLTEDLYVPTNDEDAKSFIEDNPDVSMGYYDERVPEYDGETGDLTDDDVDGFQTNMLGNHIASVKRGRCSGEEGCGLDEGPHGRIYDETTTYENKGDMEETDEENSYYAVKESETPDGEGAKYPIDNCSDVSDAWKLRGHGDYSISKSTLEERIKRRADELDCPDPEGEMDCAPCGGDGVSDDYQINPHYDLTDEETMGDQTDNGDDDGFTVNVSVDADNITVDTLAERFDAVADLRDRKKELATAMDEMRDEMGLDEDECPCDHIDSVVADAEKVEDFKDELESYREEEKEEVLDELEQFGVDREDYEDESLDALEDELEKFEEVAETFDTANIKNDTDGGPDEDDEPTVDKKSFGRGYHA